MERIIIILGVVLASMVLHELAHGVVAYLLGDDTAKREGRLSLNPLKHLDPFISVLLPVTLYLIGGPIFGGAKPVPINTRNLRFGVWGMALVAIAGPLMNLLLAFATFMIGYFTGALFDSGVLGFFCVQMVLANLGFMVFNLLPIPPLDGSRVIYAIAPDGVRSFMEKMEGGAGLTVVFMMILIFGTALSQLMSGAINGILNWFLILVGAA